MEEVLEKAIRIAVNAHVGQKDKTGTPYILHSLNVMHAVDTLDAKVVAILHDVVEHSSVTFEDLINEGIPKHLVITLRLFRHEENVSYEDYILRLSENPLAVKVKVADMKDNMDISKLKEITDEDIERLKRYVINYKFLKGRLS
ncbi:MAG: hypothetical protein RL662_201 [Bacteroidota bacterium]|jgi:(p)ppGpp synthase/HD superfamily hydrolase